VPRFQVHSIRIGYTRGLSEKEEKIQALENRLQALEKLILKE
jgi:hypothetical protein